MQKRHIALFVLTAALGAALGRAAPPINPYGLNTSGKLVPADNVPTSLLSGAISCTTAQGTGAGPTAPWAVELSDGTNYYVGPKTGQLPTALVGGRLDVNIGASSATVPVSAVAGTTPTLSVVAMTTTGAQVWAAASTAKVRKIYNQAANDTLYCVYYDGSNNVTSEATSQFSVLPGQTWEMPNFPGVVEYTGAVRCALKSATGNINATQVL